ncbi:MAG: tail fiber protein [Candidatus Omnitrophota bacterium]
MRSKRGFSLIELSMVVALGAILAGALVPNFIRSVRIEAGKKAALEMSQISEAVRAYYVDQKAWPGNLDDLRAKGFVDAVWPGHNPFGLAYELVANGVNLDIVTSLPLEICPVTAGLLPMAVVSGREVRSTVTLPGSSGGGVPAGVMVPWGAWDIPQGWLVCDGRAVLRLEQPELFAVIGTLYGSGDGHTTFNLPDLRGRVVSGLDDMGQVAAHVITQEAGNKLGGVFGEEKHRLTLTEMPEHSHTYGQAFSGGRYDGHSSALYNNTQWVQSGSAGGDQAHNNLQPSMSLFWIIKA